LSRATVEKKNRMQTEASSRWMADVGVTGDMHTATHVGFRLG
jgi:hypothetical protein